MNIQRPLICIRYLFSGFLYINMLGSTEKQYKNNANNLVMTKFLFDKKILTAAF